MQEMDLTGILFVISLVVLSPEGPVQMVQLPPAPAFTTIEDCNKDLRATFGALGFEAAGNNGIGGDILFRLGDKPGAENPHKLYAICAQKLEQPS
jgi:hypothetical protein